MQHSLLLCIDVGGTKLAYRFVEKTGRGSQCLAKGRLLCSDFSTFYDALHWLRREVSLDVGALCIAAAGPMQGDTISFTNLDWSVDPKIIRATCATDNVVLMNDLTAINWSLQSLSSQHLNMVKAGKRQGDMSLVVAPGTGLGVGFSAVTRSGLICFPSEGGHGSFAPRNQVERELLAFLTTTSQHISHEFVCSGLGLGQLFRFLTKDDPCLDDIDDTALGPWLQHQVDDNLPYRAAALQTYALFFDILAEVCGSLAVTCLPTRGVFLAGGLLTKLSRFMDKQRFIARFMDRSVQPGILSDIPIHEICHENPALVGCEALMDL